MFADPYLTGTVYFSSPLYRKNLHYKVWPKPDRGDEVLRAITNYILNEHAGHSGIIYCFSKQVRRIARSHMSASFIR